jgi:uncharacterized protein (DUF362 family)
MSYWDRREFIQSSALSGIAWSSGLFGLDTHAATGPVLSIVHYKTPPTEPDGITEEARRLTRQAVEALGGMGRFISRGDIVWVKPNIGWDRRPEQAATTNPDVVATIVEMCYQAGAKKVLISDNTCQPAIRTFPRSGIQLAAEKAGAQILFLDERKFRKMPLKGKILGDWELYADMIEANKLINVPIVKHHSLCKATLGMKNLMGIAGGARNRFHQDISKTLADPAAFVRPTLVVLDAVRVLAANGPTGGNLADVRRKDILVAGTDQVAVDAVGATLLGYKPEEIGYIVEASSRGLGNLNFNALSPRRFEV